jgi:hypothetical protein
VATLSSKHAFEAPRKGPDLNLVTGEMSSSLSIDLPFSILSPLPIFPPSSPSDVPLPPGPEGYQPNRGQPASSSKRELCVDGYIAQMFGPQVAQEYHVSLLRESGQIQVQADVAGTDAFLATLPPGTRSGQHGWVIDYAVIERGPVIPQKIWAPKKTRWVDHEQRWVDHEQLHPPIFFVHENGQDLGLPLKDAAGGNCMCLRGAEEAAPVVSSAHAQIRINVSSIFGVHSQELMVKVYPSQWCGYADWDEQISIQKQTQPRATISLETFAKRVAKKTLKFMEVI